MHERVVETNYYLLFAMRSLDMVLNLLFSWLRRSSTTDTRSEGWVSDDGWAESQHLPKVITDVSNYLHLECQIC